VKMGIIGWIIIGGIAGWLASLIVGSRQSILADIVIGIIGGLLGGFIFSLFGGAGVTGFNLYSLLVAIAGSVILLLVYHAFRRPVVT